MNHDTSAFCNPGDVSEVIVLRGGALGDFVVTVPSLLALRRRFPQARLIVVGYPQYACVAACCGLADSVVSLDSAAAATLFSQDGGLDPELEKLVASADVVVSFLHDPGGIVAANLAAFAEGRVLSVSPIVSDSHAVEHFLEAVRPLAGEDMIHGTVRLIPEDAVLEAGSEILGDINRENMAIIHPGSGSRDKNWPLSCFVELSGQLENHGMSPVFLLGEADMWMSEMIPGAFAVLDSLRIPETIGVLASARLLVGNDSGISHLAAILGVPTVALFGRTDPLVWGPRGDAVSILRGCPDPRGGIKGIAVSDVLVAARRLGAIPEE